MNDLQIPADSEIRNREFVFGVATAAFQIEGDAASRLPCIWDTFCATPGKIRDHSNGEHACDHVARWQDDVELIASLGVNAYRFSISWGRIMTREGEINPPGLAFYKNLINALTLRGIKVFVTLYHWDLPQYLEDQGGWLNRDTAYHFRDYADAVSKALGNSVYAYTTLNEPFCSSFLGYETGVHAPGITGQANGRLAAHHLMLAHGLAMPVLRRNAPLSKHGIVVNIAPCDPFSANEEDVRSARLADEYFNAWYLDPLLKGRYPDSFKLLPDDTKPHIEEGDLEIISAELDYLGINYYTRNVMRCNGNGWFEEVLPNSVPVTAMGWEVTPATMTRMLIGLDQSYQLPPVYITENGAAFDDRVEGNQVRDEHRLDYYRQHLWAVDKAIKAGVNVKGYFAWSLMDNFEWAEGYEKRFGICYVDYATQERIPKASALAIKHFLAEKAENIQQQQRG
ncbi:GH1 family beta-glucosidase [Shewanella submarina]|uniref:Beta-glucosidase n=1 Tax=Shewanella submarina TaxID=2016376 RepID=A0ABV7GB39_9GAMM|nr:GH1 family beta-glucosidase [Shewanella submarina]MCL1037008.1 GH1 family beta-glucosidase [Shewanella submarina]